MTNTAVQPVAEADDTVEPAETEVSPRPRRQWPPNP